MNNLREIMTKEISFYSWLDYSYKRGDYDAKQYPTYESWLNSLSDQEFLASYNEVRERIFELD